MLEDHTDLDTSLAFPSDGSLASDSYDNTVRVWRRSDPASTLHLSPAWECAAVLKGHTRSVEALVVLPDGCLASGGYNRTVRVWHRSDPASPSSAWACTSVLEGHRNWVKILVALSDGCLASGSTDNAVRVWRRSGPDFTSDQSSRWECAVVLEGHAGTVYAIAELPCGSLVSCSSDTTLRVWPQTAHLEWESRKHLIAALVMASARGCGSAMHVG